MSLDHGLLLRFIVPSSMYLLRSPTRDLGTRLGGNRSFRQHRMSMYDQINKLTSVFSCVSAVIDNEFRDNIVEVAVDPRGDSRVDPQTTLTML